jgi:two-component system, NarL family, nitrate/nitrite response regulator NarL
MGNSVNPIRVLIANEQPLFRDGLRLLLEEEPSFRVIGQAGDVRETVELTRGANPDVLLLDLGLTSCSGLEALSLIQSLSLPVHVLIMATTMDKFQVLDALRRGASGILLKESSIQLLRKCIRSVMEGEYWIGRRSVGELVRELKKYSVPAIETKPQRNWRLTPRQLQIVAEIISGKTNKEIALKLGLSNQTVKHHLTSIFNELGVFNRLELALFAVHHNLVFRFANK